MEKFIATLKGWTPVLGDNFPSDAIQTNWAKFYLVCIATLVLLALPILIALIFPFLKKDKLNAKGSAILYAFVTGFFMTMALFGFLRESLETSSLKAALVINSTKWSVFGWNILLVAGGLVIGLLFALSVRYLIKHGTSATLKKSKSASIYLHDHDLAHDHSGSTHHHEVAPDHSLKFKKANSTTTKDERKHKVVALLLLLTHRIPEGFLLGYSLNNFFAANAYFSSSNIAFIISFVFHLIPEELIFFYRQREMGVSKWKATLISIGLLFLFVPFMFIGIYAGQYIDSSWQVKALIQAAVAGIFFFTAIVEFFPEFYHTHHDKKLFKFVLFMFLVGVVFCAFVLSFHQHGR